MRRGFNIDGQVAVVTGGGGIICSALSKALATEGVKVAVLDIDGESAKSVSDDIVANGGTAIAVQADVLSMDSLNKAEKAVTDAFGTIDILINGAGGNKKEATTSEDRTFFDLPSDSIQWVMNLNLMGTILPTQVFGKTMAEKGEGVIINFSSMASLRPLTRTIDYSAAKAAINNFTQWLAVYMNQEYSPNIRVNAIAPGFLLTQQNHYLLVDEKTDKPTARGKRIIEHTPMGRYGVPDDLVGTILWLISDEARFVNGIIVPVDGGFAAYSGV